MRIRWKLLILLLVISLLPLTFLSWQQYESLRFLGGELGSRTRDQLTDRAKSQLLEIAENYGEVLRRARETMDLLLRAQARDVELVLAGPLPSEPPAVYWSEDYDAGRVPPETLTTSNGYDRLQADGTQVALPVTFEHFVLKAAPGASHESLADDAARLAGLVSTCDFIRESRIAFMRWQYVALESGLHACYPGHGGYPAEYDPRERPWYRDAIKANRLIWSPPMVDVSSHKAVLTISMPIRKPDGTIAGVTALDLELLSLVRGVRIPMAWQDSVETMVVTTPEAFTTPLATKPPPGPSLVAIAQRKYVEQYGRWGSPIELEYLQSDRVADLGGVVDDMKAGRSAVRTLSYKGRECVMAYGGVNTEAQVYLLIIVPQEEIVAQANAAESNILDETSRQLQAAGGAFIVVTIIVVLMALRGSRVVTEPIAQLADIAKRIAKGDFKVRSNIRSRDELGELGRTVNEMIPQLEDRMRMRHSLAVAMEVQQHLLPQSPPEMKGLDIAGVSIYCDETGGDYYDFLEISQPGGDQLVAALGDVTGHGIGAALLMATARAMLRTHLREPCNLANVFRDTNRQLVCDTAAGRFMTLVCMTYDVKTRMLRWANGGHDAPFTVDLKTRELGELDGSGIPLGIEESWEYESYEQRVPESGLLIVVGTDGIWEARDPADEMFGKDRLREIIHENADRSASEMIEAIKSGLFDFMAGAPREDDITMLVVKVLPVG